VSAEPSPAPADPTPAADAADATGAPDATGATGATGVPTYARGRLIVVLGLLSMFGPLSLDLYLPALPQLADDLGTGASGAQLTITACLIGLAAGQIVAGPLSDRYGRRRPLIIGLACFVLSSLACALAPGIAVLVAVRLVQGLSGAAGLVISRAVARDLFHGPELVVFFTRLMLINGFAPVLAPVVGGQLARVMSWRGMFIVLAVVGLGLLLAGVLGVPETLPPLRRSTGGLGDTLRGFGVLVRDRLFVGSAGAAGLAFASMFAYIAGATFVLQDLHGLSPQQFSYVFGANSVGIVAMGQLGGRLVRRLGTTTVLSIGLGLNLLGAVGLAVSIVADLGLPALLGSLFVMVSAVGFIFPTATALAMADYPERAGAASSLLGLFQFSAGAIAAPLVGIGDQATALPLAIVALTASGLGALVFLLVARPAIRARGQLAD
jgi:DHA1 family bicyclomycin/chloramphenicol resistance-like MFS transporter